MTKSLAKNIEKWKVWWWLYRGNEVVLVTEKDLHRSVYSKIRREAWMSYYVGYAEWNGHNALLKKDFTWDNIDGFVGSWRFVAHMKPWRRPLEINKKARRERLCPA